MSDLLSGHEEGGSGGVMLGIFPEWKTDPDDPRKLDEFSAQLRGKTWVVRRLVNQGRKIPRGEYIRRGNARLVDRGGGPALYVEGHNWWITSWVTGWKRRKGGTLEFTTENSLYRMVEDA